MKTILVDQDPKFLLDLESVLQKHWPCTDIVAKCTKNEHAFEEIVKQNCDLAFLNVSQFIGRHQDVGKISSWVPKTIFMANTYEHAADAIRYGASGYLLKPLEEIALKKALKRCVDKMPVTQKGIKPKYSNDLIQEQIICIPTIEGADFLRPEEIIRCEGLQKCTRIVIMDRSDLISSYNIGVFRNLLEDLGFVQPHKSHLVNRRHIRKYLREGTISMSDGSTVPVSRRRKCELFVQMRQPNRLPIIPE